MSKKDLGKRFGALMLAAVFLISSVGFTGFVIWQMNQEDKSNTINLEDQLTNNQQEGKLQGTKLQDFTPVAAVNSLQIVDLTEGNGKVVLASDTVTAHYTGALAVDGTIFESSLDSGQPATFPLNGVIKGWQEGVPGMKVGGKRRLIIPSAMAYGESGAGDSIPPNAPLVFDIELVSVAQ